MVTLAEPFSEYLPYPPNALFVKRLRWFSVRFSQIYEGVLAFFVSFY